MCANLKTHPWYRRYLPQNKTQHINLLLTELYLPISALCQKNQNTRRWRWRHGMQIIPAPTRMSVDVIHHWCFYTYSRWGRRFCISFHLNEFTCSSFIQIVSLAPPQIYFQVHNSALMQIPCKTNILRDTGECIIIIIISISCRRRAPI